MKVWYIHTLAPHAHERNNYRWRAVEKHCRDNGFDFQIWNLFHKGQHRQLERKNHSADVTFICDFGTADTLLRSRLDFKRMGFVAHITGAGWRRTTWINRALHIAKELKPNVIFLSHRVHLKRFDEIQKTFYVGLGFDPNVFHPTSDGKQGKFETGTRDVVFAGNPAMGRLRRLELLAKELGPRRIEWRQGLSHARMADFLRSGTIGWNQIGKGPRDGVSCNLRTWEVLGTGIMLLCSKSRHLTDILEDGKHAVFWKDDRDMLDKAAYYLKHKDTRKKVASQGYKEALKRHTWSARAREYLEIIKVFL